MKKIILFVLVAFGLVSFFSYKLVQVPDGINPDEASLGYDAILLARTLHDENGRFLPVFILAKGGSDWQQPVAQYLMAFIFKIAGPSLYNLRLSAVLTAVASVLLIYFLGRQLMGPRGGVIAAVVLATTPIIMIQSHLAFDNITPVPFVIGWLWTLFLFTKTKNNRWLVVSGLLLGVSYYTFKSMRIFVPMWTVLSLLYLAQDFLVKRTAKTFRRVLKPVLCFAVSILPFYAVIPWLEFQYSGAVLNHTSPAITNVYHFVYSYLANFDPSFLFIKGDELLFHSTGTHGMYLVMSLPLFTIGLISTWKKSSFWKLIILSFVLGPLLFGYLGQIHRANRLLAEIPAYAVISAAGFLSLWQKKTKVFTAVLILLFVLNYYDFIHYYLTDFGEATHNLYDCYSCNAGAYKLLKTESVKLGLVPYVDRVDMAGQSPTRDFIKTMYFPGPINLWNGDTKVLPGNAILMTDNSNIGYLKQIDHFDRFYFYSN